MKKIISIVLVLFSFYYTNKVSYILKNNDEIMKQIINVKDDYTIKPINAIIENDYIIPGIAGQNIDIDRTYTNMKRLGDFNKSLFIYKKKDPEITINNIFDKYIISGNKNNNNVAFIFRLKDMNLLDSLLNILEDNKINSLFVINSDIIFNDIINIIDIVNQNHLVSPSYDNDYIISFDMLNSINNKINYYCVTLVDNPEILNICQKNKMHTIKPNLIIDNYPYHAIKNNLSNGLIIYFDVNNKLLKELNLTIQYIRQKGFNIVSIDEIVQELN
ncbi:MAG: hypothetical protein GX861_03175 [Tenericutes bacterium]|nr:hypothetical protein [Mycoplasmatota bacterium]